MTGLVSAPRGGLSGEAIVPGDKSISHRALMIGAIATGETVISGLLEGDDVLRTAAALRLMGVEAARAEDGAWHVFGVGVGGLAEPDDVLDLGNSGTGARLLMGLVATHPFVAHFTGDASLRNRPMARIAEPVERMGARVIARAGGRMPLAVIGAAEPVPIEYALPIPSAQVKSATLLAGLNVPGTTRVIESQPSRDHTELMLRHFGARLTVENRNDGARIIALSGQPELTARPVAVPADPSSAAFPGICALITGDSEITTRGVGLNPLRAGVYETLLEMGADIAFANQREEAGEPVADITFRSSRLRAVDVPAARAPSMIDEYPILAIAAACAEGTTRMRGLAELRVKESDRLGAVIAGLEACGVRVREDGDDLTIEGAGGPPAGGATVRALSDHRIAMSFLVLGAAARAPVAIDDDTHIATSFPGFVGLMNRLGAGIERADG